MGKPVDEKLLNRIEGYRIAAIVPALNEEVAIGKTVSDLLKYVPGMEVYVFDNGSTDNTVEVAKDAGAKVRSVPQRGKGNVVRRAFADIEADIYVMIDGDDTYEVADLPKMIECLVEDNLDHVLGVRTPKEMGQYRSGHEWGNRLFNRFTSWVLGYKTGDMLSGYRVFSRRFVKSFPCTSTHFEIESELTVHMVSVRAPRAEVPVDFRDRKPGSDSKLNTFSDGMRILRTIFRLYRYEFPMRFYGFLSGILALVSLGLGIPVVVTYIHTGLVPRFPTAFLAASIGVIAVLIFSLGVILAGQRRVIGENRRLNYLQIPGVKHA